MSFLFNTVQTTSSNNSHKPRFHIDLQSEAAWIAILGLIIFTGLGILGYASILNLAFPVASFAVSLFLYQRYPVVYMGFTWWVFFLTPLIRRLVDYRVGFSDQSLILMAPFLVVIVTLPSFIKYVLKYYPYKPAYLPFILAFIGIFYSYSVGLTNPGSNIFLISRSGISVQLVQWITPISFGFFILSNWRNYPSFRDNLKRTFFWGGLVMGIYGLVQFFIMPPWDEAWQQEVIKLGYGNAVGSVWSTVNSPAMFATILIPCLALLLASQSNLKLPIAIILFLDILLTNNRTALIACVAGLILLVLHLKPHLQMQLIIILFIILLFTLIVSNIEVFNDMIDRVQTLSNVEEDVSFQSRKHLYEVLTAKAFINPIGYGMGSLNLADSGILLIFYEMGWLGVIPFLGGLILLLLKVNQKSTKTTKTVDLLFEKAVIASSYSMLLMLPNTNSFNGLSAIVIWGFPSIIIAGHKYYHYLLINEASILD